MIQDIAPHVYDNAFAHRRAPRPDDYVLYSRGGRELLIREGGLCDFPQVNSTGTEGLSFGFLIDDRAFFLGEGSPELPGFTYVKAAALRSLEPRHLAFAGITGLQLSRWMRSERYCGCCGTETEPSKTERAFVCPACGRTTYPRLMPAVTIAVMDGDRMVVSTSRERPNVNLANIAGFVEIGESFEECVRREVREEIGLEVKNIRYYKSQPWSFSDTVMIGFFCEAEGDTTLHVDETELKAARWIRREELPDRGGEASLTAEMQNLFRLGKEPKI